MNINKYTEKAQEAILGAQQLADREGHPEMAPEHLLLTLLEQRDGIVPEIVRKMNADPAALSDLAKFCDSRVISFARPVMKVFRLRLNFSELF